MVLTSPDKAGGFSGVGIISWRFGGIGGFPREFQDFLSTKTC